MNIFAHRMRRLLVLSIVIAASLAAALPPSAAHAQNQQVWDAWHLKVDFPAQPPGVAPIPRVFYTVYQGTDAPAVLNGQRIDISSRCRVQGQLAWDADGYVRFDGSSFIRCRLPAKPPGLVACPCGPFWFAADVRLTAAVAANPIFEGIEGPNRAFSFGLPVNGGLARTRLSLPGHSYTSPDWTIDSAGGNRMVIGANGPTMVAVTDHFNALGYDWLGFVDNWQGFFKSAVTGRKVGHLVQSPDATWTTNRSGPLWTHPDDVFIGYSPTTNTFFNGSLRGGEIDPVGCSGG